MPKIVTPLNDALLKSLKPQSKAYTKTDGQGLRILVKPNGTKLWEYEYTSPTLKKRRKTSFGNYPHTTLAIARSKRDTNIKLIREGIDPLEVKEAEKKEQQELEHTKVNTFEKVSKEWLKQYRTTNKPITDQHRLKILRLFELHIFPSIGSKAIKEISIQDIFIILDTMKNKKIIETARRAYYYMNRVYKHALKREYTQQNIIGNIDIIDDIGGKSDIHYPTFTKEKDIKGLLLSIDEYQGELSTKYAMMLLPYVFVRSFNIRNMTWEEIDFKNEEWIIPASKMKTHKEFILPLPHQAIKILKEVKAQGINSNLVFPGIRSEKRPISDNTLISALRRMGYTKEELVPHSFRSIFSTIAYEHMSEHNCSGEVIEALLAHQEANKVKEAYNRATYKEPMRKLIQWYADYLDRVKYA